MVLLDTFILATGILLGAAAHLPVAAAAAAGTAIAAVLAGLAVRERRARRPLDGSSELIAVALGLTGLLVFNAVLGPTAVAVAGTALAGGSPRRRTAALGLALGVADLAVLTFFGAADRTLSWHSG